MTNKKLVFFDIDGTLLNDKKTVNKSTIEAIKKLKEKDFIFCLATGRGLSEGILQLAKQLELNDYLVLANGNYVWDIKNESMTTLGMPLSKSVIDLFYHKALEYKRQLNLFYEDGSIKYYYFGDNQNLDIKDPMFFIIGQTIYNFSDIDKIQLELDKPIVHVGIKAERNIINAIYPDIKSLNDLNLAEISTVADVYIEAESFGISKWIGIQYVQRKLGISNDNTYAFGDSFNDFEMLNNVGNPIVMGNASNELKTNFKTIIGTNNSDAIANYLYKISDENKNIK